MPEIKCHGCDEPERDEKFRLRQRHVRPSKMAWFCNSCFPVWETSDEWETRRQAEEIASRGDELIAVIARAEACIADLPPGSIFDLDIYEGIILC